MGFSLLSLTQLHLSWVLLIPLVIIAFYFVNKKKIKKLKFLFFLLGSLIGGSTLVPTFIMKSGILTEIGENLIINWSNADKLIDVVINIFYLPSYEVITNSSLLGNFSLKIALAMEHEWVFPAVIIVTLFGWTQVFLYFICLIFPTGFHRHSWDRIRFLLVGMVLLVWLGYFLNEDVEVHKIHLLFLPLAFYFSIYVNEWILTTRPWSKYVFYVAFFSLLVFYVADGIKEKSKITNNPYQKKIILAIQNKDYKLLKNSN
ncbi:MAG: hypothetical protein RPU59_05290 [Candidatus Sedimenticola sp. (ex Thyasira tokunagai)]